jgi:hypothetical protein
MSNPREDELREAINTPRLIGNVKGVRNDSCDRQEWRVNRANQLFWIIILACIVAWGTFWVADNIVRPLWEDAEPY